MSREVILIVDDSRQISDFLAHKILPGLGYDVMVAYDGQSAFQMIKDNLLQIDLILLDLQLPDMTGLDLLERLDVESFHLPTILMTAHGSEQVAIEAFRLGVEDYLQKPVVEENLRGAIANALKKTRLEKEKVVLTARLEEQVSWLTALTKVGQSVTSTLELDEVLRRIVDAGVFLTHAEEGFIALLDKESGQLHLRAVKNIGEDVIRTMHLPVTDSLAGQVCQTRRPLRVAQSTETLPIKVGPGYLVHSLLHVPILIKDVPLGVLSVTNRTAQSSFKEKDEVMLCSLADYAAAALSNANLYQQARQEIVERQNVEAALRESDERYSLAVRAANDGLWDWNLKTNQVYYAPRWKEMLGYREDEIATSPNEWLRRVNPEDVSDLKLMISTHLKGLSSHFECEYRITHKDGSYRWLLSRGMAVRDATGTATRLAGSNTDITERKGAEQKLLHEALYDALTGLPNRTLFTDRLRQAIERNRRNRNSQFAVLFFDLDRFKDVNDSLGHLLGDKLLIAMAQMLRSILRPADTIARFGGDEFVVLLEDVKEASDATYVADRIQNKLKTTAMLPGHTLFLTASLGIVLSQTGYEHPEDVVRDADIAMYRAKENGRARFEIFDSQMRERIMHRLGLENELIQALSQNELQVYYQPIVALEQGRLVGFEALVRWQHPRRGLLLPQEFIRLAEDTGMVVQVDRFVMSQACRQVAEWQHRFPTQPQLQVNTNISFRQLNQTDFVQFVRQVLEESKLPPGCLNLEITEAAIIDNFERVEEILAKLSQIGVQVQIDNFGMGYSSLSYLSNLSIRALKIDRSFIHRMGDENRHLKIVQALVRLTHALGIPVVAKGVETAQQLEQLQTLQCEFIQGSLVAMPVAPASVPDLLQRAALISLLPPDWKADQLGKSP
jgi:diguanylate cyclase (GGDEF)-like protein/PAS domain S-box-containing protein